jgi:protoporphyrin/coproporphyrin ferrochelatase
VPTPGVDPRFVAMVRELVSEAEPVVLGNLGPRWGDCPAGCCANLRGPKLALCGED